MGHLVGCAKGVFVDESDLDTLDLPEMHDCLLLTDAWRRVTKTIAPEPGVQGASSPKCLMDASEKPKMIFVAKPGSAKTRRKVVGNECWDFAQIAHHQKRPITATSAETCFGVV
eukprot:CAMPEP_0172444360 /NCGR_PEP_ID=MMETSP1065-20121228/4415_1 /TAXON_ID=265537 /ORGANISM="Amphiprora paludosa, Strain CCMP125" /LENGTH=113 /DNA_ID=CAMNT_0013194859 /DNA_START=23 /DNA_END=364 /DNA_ORIENTATION=-